MRNARPSLLLVALLALPAACGRPAAERAMLEDVGAFAILPAQRNFAAATDDLRAAVDAFCAQPGDASRDRARDAWRGAMEAWARAGAVKFGPVAVRNQAWKIQFWPDRNNLVGSKLEALLAGDAEMTPETLEGASVVVQGLSAAEFLLFDDTGGTLARYLPEDPGAARRCALLHTIAVHTQDVAQHLAAAWEPAGGNYLETLAQPGADNADFATTSDAVAAMLDSVLATLEITKNDRLAGPLGMNNRAGFPQPYAAEAWRSRHSLEFIAAAIAGARELWYAGAGTAAPHFGVDDLLRAKRASVLAYSIDTGFESVAAALPEDLVLFDAVDDPEEAARLEALHAELTVLVRAIKNDVPPVLDVTLGFNSRDGD